MEREKNFDADGGRIFLLLLYGLVAVYCVKRPMAYSLIVLMAIYLIPPFVPLFVRIILFPSITLLPLEQHSVFLPLFSFAFLVIFHFFYPVTFSFKNIFDVTDNRNKNYRHDNFKDDEDDDGGDSGGCD